MSQCPSCRRRLIRQKMPGGMVYHCDQCRGRAITLPMLRRLGAAREVLNKIWQQSRQKSVLHIRPCPHCTKPMAQVHVRLAEQQVALDVCARCMVIWFDPSELRSLPYRKIEGAEQKDKDLSLKAREQLARWKIQREEEKTVAGVDIAGPDELWQWAPGRLGLPVEIDAPPLSRRPWCTWLIAILCMAGTLPVLLGSRSSAEEFIRQWGFIPARWYRYGGLTLITSFFLHAGLLHLLGNAFFLLIFGDNVEDELRIRRYVLLLLAGHVAGILLHACLDPSPHTPCVGASAGISAVLGFYAIAFPKARIGFLFHYWLRFRWITMPALWALVLFSILQAVGAYLQIRGMSGVSYLAHLGGLFVGLCAVYLHKAQQRRQRTAAAADT